MTHPNNPRLIALCSPVMGSGKSTLAEHLVTKHGFTRLAFASPIKNMTAALLTSAGINSPALQERFLYGDLKETPIKELGVSSRRIQQTLGTEWGRKQIGENLWRDITLARADTFLRLGMSVVIDDMRFTNEHDGVLARGGDVRRIVRPDARMTTAAHASEGQLDGIHMPEIWNNSTVEQFLVDAERSIFA